MSASAPPPQLPRSTGKAGEELVEGLFALAHAPGSRLLLLGIANSIDLVQQLMRPGGSLHVSGCQGLVGGSGRLAVAGLLRLPWWRLALPSPALTPPPPPASASTCVPPTSSSPPTSASSSRRWVLPAPRCPLLIIDDGGGVGGSV